MDLDAFLPDLNKTAERFRKKVQDLVAYCVTCQPYDGGDYVWIRGEETTLNDVFDSVNCPERYRDDIAQHIYCPNCGANSFEPYDTVGTQDRGDLAIQEHITVALRKHGKQIQELEKHLSLYPSLALGTPLGRKLHKEIVGRSLPTDTGSGLWYRARLVSGSDVYQSYDMGPTPVGRAQGGRYHHAGQSVLYLSQFEPTAVREVIDDADNTHALIWMQKYEIKLDNILVLRSDWSLLSPAISTTLVAALASRLFEQTAEDRRSLWKPQYFVTQFIADCARQAGYHGIVYSSTRNYGDNIAIFKTESSDIQPLERPRVLIHEPLESSKAHDPPSFSPEDFF